MPRDQDLAYLLKFLPPRVAGGVDGLGNELVELALDLGRAPIARLARGYRVLDPAPLTEDEIASIVALIGQFKRNNRAGIDRTLHRLSVIRNRHGAPIGITVRIGRHLTGVAEPLRPILIDTRDSIVLIGPPGAGKTTLLRDCARLLSEHLGPAVLVVDSHNEIGGDGDLPHPAIGMARRLQVPDPSSPFPASQYEVMLEAVRNHFPEVVIVDEITTRQEADAARTIARRGVRLIATAHGDTLADLVHNPELRGLVGGVAEVGLPGPAPGLKRAEPPIMRRAIEVRRDRMVALHHDVASSVDAILAGGPAEPDEILPVPIAREQMPPPPPVIVRTHELIPEDDPWGVLEIPQEAAAP
jgi:stage III sporulation protein SpoIIIAA